MFISNNSRHTQFTYAYMHKERETGKYKSSNFKMGWHKVIGHKVGMVPGAYFRVNIAPTTQTPILPPRGPFIIIM